MWLMRRRLDGWNRMHHLTPVMLHPPVAPEHVGRQLTPTAVLALLLRPAPSVLVVRTTVSLQTQRIPECLPMVCFSAVSSHLSLSSQTPVSYPFHLFLFYFISVDPLYVRNANIEIVGGSLALRQCCGDTSGLATCRFCPWETRAVDTTRYDGKRSRHEVEHFYSFICLRCGFTELSWEELRRYHGEQRSVQTCISSDKLIAVRRWQHNAFADWVRQKDNVTLEDFQMNPHGYIFML